MLGCMCAGSRNQLSGLGTDQWGGMTNDEVGAFLARHNDVYLRVVAFSEIVDTVGYDQVPTFPGGWQFWTYDVLDYWLRQLPSSIPPQGMAVWDDALAGWVILFPDAQGHLHYTLSNSPGVAMQINKPDFESPTPPGGSPLDTLSAIAVVMGAAVVYSVVRR